MTYCPHHGYDCTCRIWPLRNPVLRVIGLLGAAAAIVGLGCLLVVLAIVFVGVILGILGLVHG